MEICRPVFGKPLLPDIRETARVHRVDLVVAVPVAREGYLGAVDRGGGSESPVSLVVSWVTRALSGLIEKISVSPWGLETPEPVVRPLTKMIAPLAPWNAPWAGCTVAKEASTIATAIATSISTARRGVCLCASLIICFVLLRWVTTRDIRPLDFSLISGYV